MTEALSLADGVRLRPEHFGGIVCATRTGTMVEVDREAFQFLAGLPRVGIATSALADYGHEGRGGSSGTWPQRRRAEVIGRLIDLGIVTTDGVEGCRASGPAVATQASTPIAWPRGPHLSAPETVHWAITYRCGGACPDCYARRHAHLLARELSTDEALAVVQRLAGWGVLHLAVGGGEPTLRPDLPELMRAARKLGLVTHVTTGDLHALPAHLSALSGGVQAVQVGVRAADLLACPDQAVAAMSRGVAIGSDLGVSVGANLMLSRAELSCLQHLLGLLAGTQVPRLTLLRYKPPAGRERWEAMAPTAELLCGVEGTLAEAARRHPHMAIRVDCALSLLQRHLPREVAGAAGVRGCVAGSRILALAPDGTAFPCSQLVHPKLRAGSALSDDLPAMWESSPVLQRYRFHRRTSRFRHSACGACAARAHCGGCRVFSADALGADPGCPLADADRDAQSRRVAHEYPRWLLKGCLEPAMVRPDAAATDQSDRREQ